MRRSATSWLGALCLLWACNGSDDLPVNYMPDSDGPTSPSPRGDGDGAGGPAGDGDGTGDGDIGDGDLGDGDLGDGDVGDGDADTGGPGSGPQPDPSGPFAVSQRNSVQWKRYAVIEADLMRALALSADEVCREFGDQSCIQGVHRVALGGNDPFGSGILRPPEQTLSTTSVVIDRVVLSACSTRARKDKGGSPVVFTELDLAGAPPEPDAPAVTATITTLFQRLLARDPRNKEVALIQGLLADDPEGEPLTTEEFAALACFVIGSSTEFLFF